MKKRHNASLHVLGTTALLTGAVLLGAGGQQPTVAQPPATGQPAPPARGPASRVNPTSAPKGSDVGGFIQRWVILEPMRVAPQLTDSAVQAVVKKEYFPNQFTVVPHDGAAHDAHEGGLARPVLADERVDSSGGQGDADVLQCLDRAVALGEAGRDEKRGRG